MNEGVHEPGPRPRLWETRSYLSSMTIRTCGARLASCSIQWGCAPKCSHPRLSYCNVNYLISRAFSYWTSDCSCRAVSTCIANFAVQATPVVFITGHGDIHMSVQVMKAGAVDFLAKPFRDQEMLDAVSGAIERDRKRRREEKSNAEVRASGPNLTLRFAGGFRVRLARASVENARANEDPTECGRPAHS